jgi:hypothetical protein
VFYIFGCSGNDTAKNNHDNLLHKAIHKATFFDSIMSKMDIPLSQLKRHLLDPDYFSHYTRFAGDTVYYPNSDYPIIILSMDYHAVCLEKYLLVYKKNSLKNIACLLVETDCDIDYGTDYEKLDYKVFNENQFYTRDVCYEVDTHSKFKITKTDQFYQINTYGKIDSLKKKPAGVVLPKFIPINVSDDDK